MIAAMLNSVMDTSEKVAHYIKFAEENGIQVISPNINESRGKFTVKGDIIIFGMAAIKNVGINVIDSIVKTRETRGKFTSLEDFIDKIDTSAVNKRAVESLIKAELWIVLMYLGQKCLQYLKRLWMEEQMREEEI